MKIGIIGVGNIGGIFAHRLLSKFEGLEALYLLDRYPEKLSGLASDSTRVIIASEPSEIFKNCTHVILSVKPQDCMELFAQIKNGRQHNPIIISTITGIQIDTIASNTSIKKIARIMPNVPSAIGRGVTGLVFSGCFTEDERREVKRILLTMGDIVEVREKDLAAVTALSGSGPAFVFVIVESLIDVGLKMGLSYEVSRELILGTLGGSVELLKERGNHPGEFRHLVTSPGGTTIEGIYSLEREGLRGTIMKALFDTYLRAKEINAELEGKK
jgi:pyrroline-5-carboxylate reductase